MLDSRRNADYAYQVILRAAVRPALRCFPSGDARGGESVGRKTKDKDEEDSPGAGLSLPVRRPSSSAVYTAHGATGCMVPNQYWVPGMLAPMPMMGKYFVYYGLDFLSPRDLGKKCVERMVYELFNENSGICRFHRKWAEVIVDEIISSHYHFPVDYKAHQFELAKQIYDLDGAAVAPWETERTVDAIWSYLEDVAATTAERRADRLDRALPRRQVGRGPRLLG